MAMTGVVRSVVAVFLGLATQFALVIATTVAAAASLGGVAYLAANLSLSLAAAWAGGWVCARWARRRELSHGLALAAIVALLGLASAQGGAADPRPSWYGWAVTGIGAFGSIGGALAARRRGGAGES